jgi:hypothetical protein
MSIFYTQTERQHPHGWKNHKEKKVWIIGSEHCSHPRKQEIKTEKRGVCETEGCEK